MFPRPEAPPAPVLPAPEATPTPMDATSIELPPPDVQLDPAPQTPEKSSPFARFKQARLTKPTATVWVQKDTPPPQAAPSQRPLRTKLRPVGRTTAPLTPAARTRRNLLIMGVTAALLIVGVVGTMARMSPAPDAAAFDAAPLTAATPTIQPITPSTPASSVPDHTPPTLPLTPPSTTTGQAMGTAARAIPTIPSGAKSALPTATRPAKPSPAVDSSKGVTSALVQPNPAVSAAFASDTNNGAGTTTNPSSSHTGGDVAPLPVARPTRVLTTPAADLAPLPAAPPTRAQAYPVPVAPTAAAPIMLPNAPLPVPTRISPPVPVMPRPTAPLPVPLVPSTPAPLARATSPSITALTRAYVPPATALPSAAALPVVPAAAVPLPTASRALPASPPISLPVTAATATSTPQVLVPDSPANTASPATPPPASVSIVPTGSGRGAPATVTPAATPAANVRYLGYSETDSERIAILHVDDHDETVSAGQDIPGTNIRVESVTLNAVTLKIDGHIQKVPIEVAP
ncbi:hypothetical protein MF271_24340 (plasmid) [Deinococcus sp. KNUC1210]|uniref:hypothetical protein n=1 Tax=Deinococcus sp. KNUC1210 TaxID=2917691 RepID=UPI001EF046C5|nr:hypothetical protein [Deinococcus sp. KNUC1210]ULH18088.1 hypothetical protein MF271_24340 [Deinococcus sp. KNUC1210]